LFREGHLSLARSAHLAGMTMSHFATHVSRLGIAVIQLDAQEAVSDLDTLEQWLASS
jgi:predicted HTH domain antitoxin